MTFAPGSERQIAGDAAYAIGGTAYSAVPPDYEGPCLVTLEAGAFEQSLRSTAVLSEVRDAEAVARYAVGLPDGGWDRARVEPAPGMAITHPTFLDWLQD